MGRPKKDSSSNIKKSKELFDFLNGIYVDQSTDFFDSLTDKEKKTYNNSRYMLNRFISMRPVQAAIVNEIQKYTQIPARAHYLFYSRILPRGKQFNKYIKGTNEDRYPKELMSLIMKHFNVSPKDATEYLDIYKSHKDELKTLVSKYGIDEKEFKKFKF